MKGQQILAVIPARGGSKGVPKKNIRDLCGKPLVSYTIQSALHSKLITHCILSTDSEEIARVGRACGVEVPFIRPEELATDQALAIDVMRHAVVEMEKKTQVTFDFVAMLQPTSPLKTHEDIDAALVKLMTTGCDTVVGMVDVGANHPARMYTIENDRMINVMDEGVTMSPRQNLKPIYIRNGAIYACKRAVIFSCNAMIGPDCRPHVMPVERSVNIDSEADLALAEYYLKKTVGVP